MKVRPIPIDWNPDISIYASESFLRSSGEEYGWLGGFDEESNLRIVLPYTIVKKSIVRMVRFRVEPFYPDKDLPLEQERQFLNDLVNYFRKNRADLIIPGSVNTIFRTFPKGALAAPYGTLTIDLNDSEETLWKKVHSKHRNVIRNARKNGIEIRSGREYADISYHLVRDTFKRSSMPFMSSQAFERMLDGLEENVSILTAWHQNKVQGCAVIPFSLHSAYYAYGGTAATRPLTGALNLLQWEAIRCFKEKGVKRYDFCGARINPDPGSKAAGLIMFKERFGAQLSQGYMWKYYLNSVKSLIYRFAVGFLRGGDIVDQERKRLGLAGQT